MIETQSTGCYRFGIFEVDAGTGELRRKGVRVKLHSQPFQILRMMLERPGELLTRETICEQLWPDGTFVDYEHGVNSAINRIREALGDKASNPRFIETLARRGYRFIAPVELVVEGESAARAEDVSADSAATVPSTTEQGTGFLDRFLATPEDLPKSSHPVVKALFLLLQGMYLGFYVAVLANLPEIQDLLSILPGAAVIGVILIVLSAVLIPVRIFLICAVLFRAPGLRRKFLKMWWFLLPVDVLWSLSPFLLLHHIPYGLAMVCMSLLVYSPFAQRSLMLMGADGSDI